MHEEKTHRTQIKVEIDRLASLEEISWRPKSHVLWLKKEGDNKTCFFHRLANSCRRANHVRGIELDNLFYEDAESAYSGGAILSRIIQANFIKNYMRRRKLGALL